MFVYQNSSGEGCRTNRNSRLALFWQIFIGFLKIGAFTFGGGFAMLPLIRREVVTRRHWLGEEEFVDVLGIAQSSPGPIAVNSAVFSGYRIAGLAGATVALFGVVLPSFLTILVLTTFLIQHQNARWLQAVFMGVRPAILAQIVAGGVSVARSALKTKFTWLLAFVGLGLLLANLHPIIVIALAGLAGISYAKFGQREGGVAGA